MVRVGKFKTGITGLFPMAERTYYEILNIAHDVDEAEIRRAYRIAVQQHHPDQNPDDVASARRIRHLNAARDTLLDPELRQKYDAKLRRRGLLPEEDPPPAPPETPSGEGASSSEPVPPMSDGFYAHDFRSSPEPEPTPWQTAGQPFPPQRASRPRKGNGWAKNVMLLVGGPSMGHVFFRETHDQKKPWCA